jgi:hypothetical protein
MTTILQEQDEIVGFIEVGDAVKEAIRSADIVVAREALARVLERYHDDFPDEHHFALGAAAPALLQEIFHALLASSEADEKPAEKDRAKRRQVFRLVRE